MESNIERELTTNNTENEVARVIENITNSKVGEINSKNNSKNKPKNDPKPNDNKTPNKTHTKVIGGKIAKKTDKI